MNDVVEAIEAIFIGLIVAKFLLNTCRGLKAVELCDECLLILNNKSGIKEEKLTKLIYNATYLILFEAYYHINDYTNAIKYGSQILQVHRERSEASCYGNLGTVYQSLGNYERARKYHEKALPIKKEVGDRKGEAACYENLGTLYQIAGLYERARDHYEKALAMRKEIGDRQGEGNDYGNLGAVFLSLSDYVKAEENLEKALALKREIGDRKGEAWSYGTLGNVFQSVGEYEKASKCNEKALEIRKEIKDREGETSSYRNLGSVYQSLSNYKKARECYDKVLLLEDESGDRNGRGTVHANLGTVLLSLGDYVKAKEHFETALAIRKKLADRKGEASCYGNLATVYQYTGEYDKAKQYLTEALAIQEETDDRKGKATSYGRLGTMYQSFGEYEKAREHHEQALAITKKIGDKKGEASCYGNLGALFQSLGEYVEARQYHEKSLALRRETGDRNGEALDLGNLGTLFLSLGKYSSANEHLQKALAIQNETGDRRGEATSYGNLGSVFQTLGDYGRAQEYYGKSLAFSKDICNREQEAANYANLGTVFKSLGNYAKAEEYQKKGLAISERIGDIEKQFLFLCNLAELKLSEGKAQEALCFLLPSIKKCEILRLSLQDNDQFKISFSDGHVFPYLVLSSLFCTAGKPYEALVVSEQGRARALADLLSTQYSVEKQHLGNPQLWVGIERIMDKECNCTCLFISYSSHNIFLWILRASRVIHFRTVEVRETIVHKGLAESLNNIFSKQSFRNFGNLPDERCENRSLNAETQKTESLENVTDYKGNQNAELNLSLCHKLIFAPVADLMEDPEIIIVPERSLYNIPFAALPDESGKYLSETYRIRIVPSLTTLKLIQDSPADYHNQTGALIVGNPDVGRVRYKGGRKFIPRLPFAENEAKMIADKLGVTPLLGKEATKAAVLQAINSVSLIHFAAHGDSERGEIALAPPPHPPNRIPREEDYLLTMSDISNVQRRAKLVVLSCCHSGRGHIRTEGVVGIARAFLGSGARSVLVALWALEDSATEQFMNHFYEHLVRGDSASESFHEAMKWMRCNGFSDVRQWAPFMLIGDNVTFK